jgi:Na+:H+ antiporter
MDHTSKLLLELFLMFAAGKLLGEILEWCRQPPVVGELIAGILLGPSVLGMIQADEATMALAEIGVIFLLFTVGLETQVGDLLKVGGTAALVAALGVIVPFFSGFAYFHWTSHGNVESIFVGAAMVATSVGITARVLADLHMLDTRMARVILGAAVIDDILGMLVLAVVTSLSRGRIDYVSLGVVSAEAIGFTLLMVFVGSRVIRRIEPAVAKLRRQNSAFYLSILLCLGLSLASIYIGMAAIIGAFLAGLALSDISERWKIREHAHPISEFLAPFFFVLLGAQVDLRTILQPGVGLDLAVICLLAVISKTLGCGAGALALGMRDAARIGVGMVPRGEVGLIVAAVGLRLNTISEGVYTVVFIMSIFTTLFAPPVLKWMIPRQRLVAAVVQDVRE